MGTSVTTLENLIIAAATIRKVYVCVGAIDCCFFAREVEGLCRLIPNVSDRPKIRTYAIWSGFGLISGVAVG